MSSKAFTDRQKQVDHLVGYIHTHAETTAKILTARARKLGADDAVPNLLRIQRSQASWLAQGQEALHRAESAYLRMKHRAPELRKRRGELTRTLYDKVVALRGFLERVYGKPSALRLTGLQGRTPRDPYELAQAGLTLVDRLRTHGAELPEPEVSGLDYRPAETATALEPLARELSETLRALNSCGRETELAMLTRNRMRRDLDDLITGTQEMMDGFYVAAGLRHLVPGIRTPGASMQRALRTTSKSSRRLASQDLAEFERQNPASHAVRTRDPVLTSQFQPLEARSESLGSRSHPHDAGRKDLDAPSHAVRTRPEEVPSRTQRSISRSEDPNSPSHAVQRRNRGGTGGREAVEVEGEDVGMVN